MLTGPVSLHHEFGQSLTKGDAHDASFPVLAASCHARIPPPQTPIDLPDNLDHSTWPRTAAQAGLDIRVRSLKSEAVVLALLHGGVPVAAEVAWKLHAPLDLLIVRCAVATGIGRSGHGGR